MKNALLSSLAALAGMVLSLVPAAAQDVERAWERDRGRFGIELFSEPNYQGERRFFSTQADLHDNRFNDTVHSVRIVGGVWELCLHSGFGGRCITLDRDEPNLDRIGFANTASSVRPSPSAPQSPGGGWGGAERPWSGAGLRLYEFEGLTGRAVTLQGGVDNLATQGFNDAARSLSTRGRWLVCQHAGFQGACREVSGEVSDLRAIGLWGAISSARPIDEYGGGYPGGGNPGGGWGAPGRPDSEGRTAAFFRLPTLDGRAVPACLNSSGRACMRQDADQFCRTAGYRESAHASLGRGRRGDILEDVLCVR